MRTFRAALLAAVPAFMLSGCYGQPDSTPKVSTQAMTTSGVIYVSEQGRNVVEGFDYLSGTLVQTIATAGEPTALGLSANAIAVAERDANDIAIFNYSSAKIVAHAATGPQPVSVCDGYGDYQVAGSDGSVTFVSDSGSNAIDGTMTLGERPSAYYCNGNTSLAVLPTAKQLQVYQNRKVVNTFLAGASPWGLGFGAAPNGPGDFIVVDQISGTSTLIQTDGSTFTAGGTGTAAGPTGITALDSTTNDIVPALDPGTKSVYWYDVAQRAFTGTPVTLPGTPVRFARPNFNAPILVTRNPDQIVILDVPNRRVLRTISLATGSSPSDVIWAPTVVAVPATPAPVPTPTIAPTPTPAPTSTPSAAANVYVADYGSGNTFVYPLSLTSGSPTATVGDTSGHAYGIAEDPQHGLIAEEDDAGKINILRTPLSNSSTPTATMTLPRASTGMLAFDVHGNLYVTIGTSGVLEYSPPFSSASTPSNTFTLGDHTLGITFDVSGNMFVSNYGSGNIQEVSMPGGTVTATVTPPASTSVGGMSVFNNKLYAVDASNNVVVTYSLPLTSGATPAAVYRVSGFPQAVTFDPSGNMLVSNISGSSVDIYAPPFAATMTPLSRITGITAPEQTVIGP